MAYIVQNARIVGLVRSGERDTFWELNSAVSLNLELDTVGVELRATDRVLGEIGIALMKSNQLRTEEVEPSLEPGGNAHVHEAVVRLELRGDGPLASRKLLLWLLILALLEDLDERVLLGRVRREIRQDRACTLSAVVSRLRR